MWPAIALGVGLFAVAFIGWTAGAAVGGHRESVRRDVVLRRLTVPVRPSALPFDPEVGRRVPRDLRTTHLGGVCPDGASAPEQSPRPGSLTARLQAVAAGEVS